MDEWTFRQREARIVLRKDFSEEADRGEQLMRRQMLVAEYQHRTVDKGAIEALPCRLVDRLSEIDAANLRPGVLGERSDRVTHQPVSIGRLESVAHSLIEAS